MVQQRIMWPSITRANGHWTHDAASRHTIAPISRSRPSPRSPQYQRNWVKWLLKLACSCWRCCCDSTSLAAACNLNWHRHNLIFDLLDLGIAHLKDGALSNLRPSIRLSIQLQAGKDRVKRNVAFNFYRLSASRHFWKRVMFNVDVILKIRKICILSFKLVNYRSFIGWCNSF